VRLIYISSHGAEFIIVIGVTLIRPKATAPRNSRQHANGGKQGPVQLSERAAEHMGDNQHWENIYTSKPPNEMSWYREHLDVSLQLIDTIGLDRNAAIIDVGGGASTLARDLLARQYTNLSVVDISPSALEKAQEHLRENARVDWIVGDITQIPLEPGHYSLWHDRAVFHFLLDADERSAYVVAATRAVKPDGFLIIATFSPDGPTKCSGLPVMRYSPEQLAKQFPKFRVIKSETEQHETPSGQLQSFTYLLMQRRDSTPY